MPGFKLTLEYDGTDFAGWQSQAQGERTVQDTLETVLGRLVGRRVSVVGAGRTDAGVHAVGQVASVSLDTGLQAADLQRALNANLPEDLCVSCVEPAAADFNARWQASGKLYVYAIWNAAQRSPLRARRFHHVARPLSVAEMARAAVLLEGTHDFRSFQAAGTRVTATVRSLRRVAVLGVSGGEIHIEVEGDGFLRHMVRNLVGTLLEVGHGRRSAGSLPELLEARDRRLAGPTAAARGLTLLHVRYERPEVQESRDVSAPAP